MLIHEIILTKGGLYLMKKEQLKSEWEAKVAEFKASGLTQTQWCKEKDINLRSFNRWYNILKNETPKYQKNQKWIPLKIEESSVNMYLNIKVGKAVIEVTENFNPKILSNVLKVLNEIC